MQKNLDRLGGLVHSQRVLIALTKAGMSREDAYKLVQKHAMEVWQGKGDFLTLLKADKQVRAKLKPRRARRELRPRLPLQARRHDLQARVRQGLISLRPHSTVTPLALIGLAHFSVSSLTSLARAAGVA